MKKAEPNNLPPREKIAPCDLDDTCEMASCDECLKQLPRTAMVRMDMKEYIQHFCGKDCLEKWQKRRERSDEK